MAWLRTINPVKYASAAEEHEMCTKAMVDSEIEILDLLGWKIVPEWTSMEMIYLTGFLQDAPPLFLEVRFYHHVPMC